MRTKRFAKTWALSDPRALPFDRDTPEPDWAAVFGRPGPLFVELGMGSGRSLAYSALVHPHANHVGVEEKYHRVVRAEKLADRLGTPHLRFLVGDAFQLDHHFAPGSVERLTILFPDPWPRAKGERFRLTNPRLVEKYHRWLTPGGLLQFRTDHETLYTYSRERFRHQGFELEEAIALERPVSEFEQRYLAEGRPLYGFTARRS